MNWDQLKTIAWLRWRLARNQWARGKNIGAALAAIATIAACLSGLMAFGAGLLGGIFGMGKASPAVFWGVWLGASGIFLFLWMIGLLAELQRSETIDLQKLMHLPVRLGQVFTINYIVSHLSTGFIITFPAIMGLALGTVISCGAKMILLLPLATGMIFMVTAWTYCLRGWLATLMSNPRKRRTVTTAIMFFFILISQGPNLYFNVMRHSNHVTYSKDPEVMKNQLAAQKAATHQKLDTLKAAQMYVPPLWLAWGAQELKDGNVLPALGGAIGCWMLAALGLRRAYMGTLKYYRGDSKTGATPALVPIVSSASPVPRAAAAPPVKASMGLMEWKPPLVPEESAALALATFRSMLRAPEVKMAWGSSMLATIVIAVSFLFRGNLRVPEAGLPFVATGAMVFAMFMLVQFFSNQFGFDRDGFRAYVLSPVDRRLILLGKNLACLPAGLAYGLIILGLLAYGVSLPLLTVGAAVLQLLTLLMLAGMAGNLLSIWMPYKIQAGSMKPTKMPGLTMFVMMLCHIFFPIAMAPVFIPPLAALLWDSAGLPLAPFVNIAFSVLVATGVAVGYWYSLAPLGRLLRQREIKILNTVTAEIE